MYFLKCISAPVNSDAAYLIVFSERLLSDNEVKRNIIIFSKAFLYVLLALYKATGDKLEASKRIFAAKLLEMRQIEAYCEPFFRR